jgi:putative transposase
LPEPPGSRERGFGTLKYEWRYIDEIDDAVMRAKHAEQYRIDYNRIRAHEDIAWTAPGGASGPANPTIPTFRTTEIPSVFTRDNLAQFQVADRRQLRRRRPGRN